MTDRLANRARRAATYAALAVLLATPAFAPPTVRAQEIDPETARQHARALSQAFRDAAKLATPSVVKIESKTKAKRVNRAERENPFKGTPFEDFFNDRFGDGMQTPPRAGVGSGVIIDASGLILTNNHVVEGADELLVHLADGREFKATDVRTDPRTDLAIIRIQAEGSLPVAKLGDSDKLFTGDWVIAIGNPFELEQTVSAGIISGQGRELGSIERTRFLQTDAAINPGNSGGPLVNLDGEVIGINTAIASSSGGNMGVGFAIPVNLAKRVARQLIDKGTVERAYLGIGIGELTTELAEQLGVDRGHGVVVAQVFPDTPAAEAGVQEGDVVLTFAGHPVSKPSELQEFVESSPIDSTQKLELLRNGNHQTVEVVVKALPKQFGRGSVEEESAAPDEEHAPGRADELGITVENLSPEVAQQLDLPNTKGVVITEVDPASAAAETGLRPGMAVLRVGKKPVSSVEEFMALVKSEATADGVLLLVRTSQGNRFVVLKH
ncbi:MAG: Do family serine endopeptidase [Pirellulales bacterium]|nr:Do family serine endopeptidase [Pirellulales bacterium]